MQSDPNLDYLNLHPADLADHIQRQPTDLAREMLQQLPAEKAAAVIAELNEEKARELLPVLSNQQLSEVLRQLPHDKAADLAGDLPFARQHEALAGLPADDSAKVVALLRYPEDTAGGIMNDRFITLGQHQTLRDAQETLRQRTDHDEADVSYLYITDENQRLNGIVSLRDLVFGRPDRKLGDIMNRDVKFLWADADQEEIARQFEHYHYMGLPVLERDRRLVGIVRASDAIEVAQAEATEDMQLMVGVSGEERTLSPWQKSIGRRLPWLYVNLATAFLAAAVVNQFESTIASWTVLAVFLPIVAGQGGNAGIQSLTVIIRDMALGEISSGDGRRALIKELILGLVNGLAIGAVVGFGAYFWKGDWRLGLIVGVAMLLNMLAAGLSGVLIPYGLKAIRVDPALASSIFLTTVTDVAGFFFFLSLAALGLKIFG